MKIFADDKIYGNAAGSPRQTEIIPAISSIPVNTGVPRTPRAVNNSNTTNAAFDCQIKLQVQLNCINGANSAAWYYGIRTPQDLEKYKADFMQNCQNNTISTMFPSNFCGLTFRAKKAEGEYDDELIFIGDDD